MRRVFVGHSSEGFHLHVQDAPAWAWAVEAIAGSRVLSWLDAPLTRRGDLWQWLMSTPWRHVRGEWTIPCPEGTALAMSEPGTWNYVYSEDE